MQVRGQRGQSEQGDKEKKRKKSTDLAFSVHVAADVLHRFSFGSSATNPSSMPSDPAPLSVVVGWLRNYRTCLLDSLSTTREDRLAKVDFAAGLHALEAVFVQVTVGDDLARHVEGEFRLRLTATSWRGNFVRSSQSSVPSRPCIDKPDAVLHVCTPGDLRPRSSGDMGHDRASPRSTI